MNPEMQAKKQFTITDWLVFGNFKKVLLYGPIYKLKRVQILICERKHKKIYMHI